MAMPSLTEFITQWVGEELQEEVKQVEGNQGTMLGTVEAGKGEEQWQFRDIWKDL